MKMLFCVIYTIVCVGLFSQTLEYKLKNGIVYVGGKNYSKQVYYKTENVNRKITDFKNWELIDSIYVDPAQQYLLVYHKADKTTYYKISLYDLKTNEFLGSTNPGMRCNDVKWHKERIIICSATSGGGNYLFLYDYKLEKINLINNYGIELNVEQELCFSTPIYAAQAGEFVVYDLKTGNEENRFNFKNITGENYYLKEYQKIEKRRYEFILSGFETDKIYRIEKLFD